MDNREQHRGGLERREMEGLIGGLERPKKEYETNLQQVKDEREEEIRRNKEVSKYEGVVPVH